VIEVIDPFQVIEVFEVIEVIHPFQLIHRIGIVPGAPGATLAAPDPHR
jgi:hypothetical protein